MKTNFLFFLSSIFFISCNQWSEEDSVKYMEHCEKSKFTKEECQCHLNKIKDQFISFDHISENEDEMAKIFKDCFQNDLKTEPEPEPEQETTIEKPTEDRLKSQEEPRRAN